MGSSRSEVAGKERLKWTQELHDLFEKSVNQLGGPESKCNALTTNHNSLMHALFLMFY